MQRVGGRGGDQEKWKEYPGIRDASRRGEGSGWREGESRGPRFCVERDGSVIEVYVGSSLSTRGMFGFRYLDRTVILKVLRTVDSEAPTFENVPTSTPLKGYHSRVRKFRICSFNSTTDKHARGRAVLHSVRCAIGCIQKISESFWEHDRTCAPIHTVPLPLFHRWP